METLARYVAEKKKIYLAIYLFSIGNCLETVNDLVRVVFPMNFNRRGQYGAHLVFPLRCPAIQQLLLNR